MKRGIVLTIALAIVLVFALGAVAMAAPNGGNAGGNNNPLGELRASQGGAVLGAAIPSLTADIHAGIAVNAIGTGDYIEFANFGDLINQYKMAAGFK